MAANYFRYWKTLKKFQKYLRFCLNKTNHPKRDHHRFQPLSALNCFSVTLLSRSPAKPMGFIKQLEGVRQRSLSISRCSTQPKASPLLQKLTQLLNNQAIFFPRSISRHKVFSPEIEINFVFRADLALYRSQPALPT